jgi:hypothetical protein
MADQSPSGSVEQPKSEGGSLLFSPPIYPGKYSDSKMEGIQSLTENKNIQTDKIVSDIENLSDSIGETTDNSAI